MSAIEMLRQYNCRMTDQGSSGGSRRSAIERIARRLLEMVSAAAFLVDAHE
jgi:hypothetical protein